MHWPITMTQAARIARIAPHEGTDKEIAGEYGISEALVREIRGGEGYNGVSLPVTR